jgi:hypothetical protein
LERIWKGGDVASFEVLGWQFIGVAERKHETPAGLFGTQNFVSIEH